MKKINILRFFIIVFFISGCATHNAKYRQGANLDIDNSSKKEIEKSFYLIGDAGGSEQGETSDALKALSKKIQNTNTKEDYAIFLGDNIYQNGLPPKDGKNRELAEHRVNVQIEAVENFEGEVLFIPGNHDWYNNGLKGLKRQEEYIEEALKNKNAFQPEKGCPIKKIDVTDNIVLLVLDTQWYLTDWDKHPTINDECEIKTRNEFILEIEGELKKNNEKTILLTMHHPAFTNGPHGGMFNAANHIFPFNIKIPMPLFGTIAAQVRAKGSVSLQDRYNSKYDEMMRLIKTLAKGSDRLIFVSGHEHSLQYIEDEGLKQIVSGSGSKRTAAALGKNGLFSYGNQGFAVLDVYTDGSSEVKYYSAENGDPSLIYKTQVYETPKEYDLSTVKSNFEPTRLVTAYDKEDTKKSNGYQWFWGDHYRYVYGVDIEAPVATLDTLMGGFTIARKGGGHQSRSLRLLDKDGRNFALRGVKKSAVRFLQSTVFRTTFVEEDFKGTISEDVLLDFYTSSHPYASFTVGDLAEAIGVYHTNPVLLFVPKHKALGKYNEEFGDELYILEERPDDDFINVASFGKPDAIESTDDVLKNLRKDEKYQIDEPAFIKARLFDMLIGDWDRHQDQWRWSRFDISDDKKIYRPIPRDRDQAFSNYDGALLDFLKLIIQPAKAFQEYDGELKDIKWINSAGIKLDRNFTQNSTKEDWLAQARFIQENLSDTQIEAAFKKFPLEVIDDTTESIKDKLKVRRGNLVDIASRYYDYLSKLVILTGTDKDDHFEITRNDGSTTIAISRIKDKIILPPYRERVVSSKETKELWIYGLDDDDTFSVTGNGRKPIFTRIIGGQNNDTYDIKDGRSIKVFEHHSKPNTVVNKGGAVFRFKDIYSNNTYEFNKYIQRINTIIPSIGSNPDDGFKVGITDTYIVKGFTTFPHYRKHIFKANYFFATQGFDFKYDGEFANTFGKWYFAMGAQFASENFTQNFFGYGSNTSNLEDSLGLDYNRVKTGILKGKIGVVKMGHLGSKLALMAEVEQVDVEETPDRYLTDDFEPNDMVFEKKSFSGIDATYSYSSTDVGSDPTRGMHFRFQTGFKSNLDDFERTYGYIIPSVQFYNSLTNNRKLVLHTKIRGHFNIGEAFEFYQAAVLGADTGLRGYRTQRFSGQSALVFGADLKYKLLKFKTGLLPLELGIFGGYDIGRVWVDNDPFNTWHDDFGGGISLSALEMISGQFGIFNSEEGLRFSFGFGMSL
jgi:hypothetical protein